MILDAYIKLKLEQEVNPSPSLRNLKLIYGKLKMGPPYLTGILTMPHSCLDLNK